MQDTSLIKRQLQRRLVDLVRRKDKIEAHIIRGDNPLPVELDEQLPEAEMAEVFEALDDNARGEIVAVRHALSRIDAGTYELCESCGDPIGEGRLAALPTASRCVSCASEQG